MMILFVCFHVVMFSVLDGLCNWLFYVKWSFRDLYGQYGGVSPGSRFFSSLFLMVLLGFALMFELCKCCLITPGLSKDIQPHE